MDNKTKWDFSTGGWLIMSGQNGLLIPGDHLFLNCKKNGRRLINKGVLINPDLTLYIMVYTMVYIMVNCGKIVGLASKSW